MDTNNLNKFLNSISGVFKSKKDYPELMELDPTNPTKYLDLIKMYYVSSYETFNEQEQDEIIRRTKITINRTFFIMVNLAFTETKKLLITPNFERTANYFLQLIEDFIILYTGEFLPNNEKKNDELMELNLKHLYGLNLYKSEVLALLGNQEKPKDEVLKTENTDLPEIELNTQQEQIRLLYDLGIINYLQNEFKATLKGNNNQTALLISQILKLGHSSVQPTLNALLSDNKKNRNYPKITQRTKAIIELLNANELK